MTGLFKAALALTLAFVVAISWAHFLGVLQ